MAFDTKSGLRILRYVVDGALVALIAVVLFGAFLARVVPLSGHEILVIGGGSMEPAIGVGSLVVEERVKPEDLRVGDVVSLHSGPELQTVFTHRITRIVDRPDGWWIETKGDANKDVDPSITPFAQVIGRVTVAVPDGGYLIEWLAMPSGMLATFSIGAALFVLALIIESLEQEYAPARKTVRETGAAATAGTPGDDPAANPKRISAVLAAAREARDRRARWLSGAPPKPPAPAPRRAMGDRTIE
jgi:signal peptidase I